MWKPIRLIPDDTHIHFVRQRKLAFAFSVLILAASLYMLATKGLNWGIDFTGGLLMELRTEQPADVSALRGSLEGADFGEITLQTLGAETDILLRMELGDLEAQGETVAELKTMIEAIYPDVTYRKVEFVGPTVGRELIIDGALALGLAILGILAYVWVRFEWQYGVGAVLALVHDGILTLGFYSVFGYEFGLASIAAILTVLGYSINDTVVIYDRIRENLRKFKKLPLEQLLDRSINDTLARTLLTGGTTMVALLALVIYGGGVIEGFAAAILFGVVIGTYSSVYIAAPVLIQFNLRRESNDAAAVKTNQQTA